ncbi:DUF4360 domain-containing protein [Actinoplanes teichomyceticus]|uniref:Uncharacterized protein DUF4360 n=1 Tax=Actinoplanes teichomyceticus TaxID=1867 RepID=A0A561WAJ9_ACTTI|nr:DUF4360 domain-containing protein [Actinoplanes teichomyceticus]TWG20887.1 uncharacterized protein DUF4360 [Actinoplanes teichomyceticus]GIF16474.1 hypothetical protein Ate01nite_65060 [Actinoplanes teichomyceticus]
MLSSITAGALLVSSLSGAPATTWHGSPPPADRMVIDVVSANGSGCPGRSADVQVSPDNTAFTVTYSDFIAQVGPDAEPTDFRKNCQLALDVHVPQGFTYAVAGADHRGFGHLEEGASGTETASYYFQGEPHTTRIRHDFHGWMDSEWQHSDRVEVGSMSYLPCGEQRYLNVNTELRVDAGSSESSTTSFLTMDSTDGSLETTYHVSWLEC